MIYFDILDSTNAYAKTHFSDLADGELIAAGEQTRGCGRLGRKWSSLPGNLFASYILHGIEVPFLGVVSCSLATLNLIRELCPEHNFYIKWPNDIFCERFKISGILAEYIRTSSISGLIVGIGVNIAMTQTQLSEVGQPAVSLYSLTGRTCDIIQTLKLFETKLEYWREQLNYDPLHVFECWKSENALLQKKIDFDTMDGKRISGIFDDIADDGTAIVLLPNGAYRHLNCGDVRVHLEED